MTGASRLGRVQVEDYRRQRMACGKNVVDVVRLARL